MVMRKVKIVALSILVRKEQKERERFLYFDLGCSYSESCFVKMCIYILHIFLKYECPIGLQLAL